MFDTSYLNCINHLKIVLSNTPNYYYSYSYYNYYYHYYC